MIRKDVANVNFLSGFAFAQFIIAMKGIKGRSLVKLITAFFLCGSLVFINLFTRSNSLLYLYLFISSVFFAATNLLLISLKRVDISRKKSKIFEKLSEVYTRVKRKVVKGETRRYSHKVHIHKRTLRLLFRFLVYILVVFSCTKQVVGSLTGYDSAYAITTGFAVVTLIYFIFLLILDKFCKHSQNNTPFVEVMLKNCRVFIKLLAFQSILTVVCTWLCSYEIFDADKYLTYFLAVYFYYYLLFTAISLVIIVIKRNVSTEPYIKIFVPFSSEDNHFNFIDYLETGTGITMRSLWSVKYIKKIAPITIVCAVFLFWLSTGIVQVEPFQEAAVYRFGILREKTLDSGLHMVLPYPIDKTEIYDTDTIKKVTIGYKSSEPTDNIWTSSHGGDEYKLLLGNGDELVSINLRLEYKISDLKKYLRSATAPELILEAFAYELVTDKTITTDLSTLLSADREAFAENFQNELSDKLAAGDIGIEVVCVILESIHPPVEISSVYQQIISAEITAEKYILDATAKANVKIAQAQSKYDSSVNKANADHSEKIAAAKSSVAEFTASLEMFNKYSDKYKYQKYLAAVCEAYGKANLVIISDDIDSSAIYFGSFSDTPVFTPKAEESLD